jgi:putative transposase
MKWIEAKHPELSLRRQCELASVSYASLYYQPSATSEREVAIKRRLDEVYTAHPYYGSRKIAVVLASEFGVSRPTVQAYMRKMGLHALVPPANTSKRAPQHPVYPYLLRNVTARMPNHIWGIDITYIRLQRSWLYLVAILDWHSRYVVSWELSQTLEIDFVIHAIGITANP